MKRLTKYEKERRARERRKAVTAKRERERIEQRKADIEEGLKIGIEYDPEQILGSEKSVSTWKKWYNPATGKHYGSLKEAKRAGEIKVPDTFKITYDAYRRAFWSDVDTDVWYKKFSECETTTHFTETGWKYCTAGDIRADQIFPLILLSSDEIEKKLSTLYGAGGGYDEEEDDGPFAVFAKDDDPFAVFAKKEEAIKARADKYV